jgi:hypothetical protein
MPERFAIYFAPPTDSELSARAAAWLGRDASGRTVELPYIAGTDTAHRLAISQSARRYGFHATIKAPMALAPGRTREELEAALSEFAAESAGASIGRLKLVFIDGFLALVPVVQTEALTSFAQRVVERFEPFRAALSPDDREQRISTGRLSARQIALLDRFGYPYVAEEFRFHMTLTDRLPQDAQAAVLDAARSWFDPALAMPIALDRLVLFHEPAPGEPFVRAADFKLTTRVTADA